MRERVLPPIVLAYHSVHEQPGEDPWALVMPPALLEAQIRFLRRCGYRFLSVGQMLAESGPGRPSNGTAVLTFDDGWRDGLTIAAPLLNRLGVAATFYVCPGRWGAVSEHVHGPAGQFLTADEARRLHEAGMELGAHSLTHPDLRTVDDARLRDEVAGSKAQVEAITGEPCRSFAYPWGTFDDRLEAAVAAAGFDLAFTWEPGRWRRAFAAPRLPAPSRRGADHLAARMVGLRRAGRPSKSVPVA